MSMFESDVFSRQSTGQKEFSATAYNAVIGMCLFWGFFVNWLLIDSIDPWLLTGGNRVAFIVGYFASCLLGVYLFNSSDKPLVSFIGYNLVVVPFGLVVNIVVSRYDQTLVMEAVQSTMGVTVVMMILGTVYPRFFQKISGALTSALCAVLAVELYQIFILRTHSDWIDWAVAILFCGYIGYDWGRANQIPKTLDNAVDSAAALYMDIINLFVRILAASGRK